MCAFSQAVDVIYAKKGKADVFAGIVLRKIISSCLRFIVAKLEYIPHSNDSVPKQIVTILMKYGGEQTTLHHLGT